MSHTAKLRTALAKLKKLSRNEVFERAYSARAENTCTAMQERMRMLTREKDQLTAQ